MEHLNYAFPLTGPQAMAPVHRPPKWEHGQQVSVELTILQRTFILREVNPPITMTIRVEVKASPQPPPSTGQSNFVRAFSWLRAEYQQQMKRPNTNPEQLSQETRRRKSTESGDSTYSEIFKETETLEITSPWKTGSTRYEQYLAYGGIQLIVRMAQPKDYASGAITKHPMSSHLGLKVVPDNTMDVVDDGDEDKKTKHQHGTKVHFDKPNP